jgi:ribosomal-protein-alanine N-acetyltransferase
VAALPGEGEEVVIDRMKLTDLDDVLEVERLSYPTPWSRRAFLSELTENAYAHYLVARSEDRVVGYVGMWLILDECHITNIAVHPTYRRLGIGRRLLQSAVDFTESAGGRRITLEVRRSNLVAQHLYTSFGFRNVGVRKGYYTDNHEDAFIMVRETEEARRAGPGR